MVYQRSGEQAGPPMLYVAKDTPVGGAGAGGAGGAGGGNAESGSCRVAPFVSTEGPGTWDPRGGVLFDHVWGVVCSPWSFFGDDVVSCPSSSMPSVLRALFGCAGSRVSSCIAAKFAPVTVPGILNA